MTATYFAHFPLLVVSETCDALDGSFVPLTHELFETLDRDWAVETYFERTKVVVWRKYISLSAFPAFDLETRLAQKAKVTAEDVTHALQQIESEQSRVLEPIWDDCDADVQLLYAGLLCQTSEPYPDPLSSARYLMNESQITRRFGIRDRTSLLNGETGPQVPRDVLLGIGALANTWKRAGLSWEDRAFSLVRALAFIFSHDTPIHLRALPLVVALEGMLVPNKTAGIARAIARVASDLLGPNTPANLSSLAADLYDWRSDIIHGRPLASTDWTSRFTSLAQFSRLVSMTILDRVVARGLQGNDIAGALAK